MKNIERILSVDFSFFSVPLSICFVLAIERQKYFGALISQIEEIVFTYML